VASRFGRFFRRPPPAQAVATIAPPKAPPVPKMARRVAPLPVRAARAEYEGASYSRRTANWRRNSRDANAELNAATMMALRGIARDITRNNPFGANAKKKWADFLVGPGITFQVYRAGKVDKALTTALQKHLESTACDPLGQSNVYQLQYQAAMTMVEAGGCLARRRWRRKSDGLPLPFQVQVMEPDYINMQLSGPNLTGGARILGVELDAIGRKVGYWLYSGHPGAILPGGLDSKLVPVSEVAYVFRPDRPEGLHGATWFAPCIVRIKDFGDYEDAQLVRQKIASCYSVFRIGVADQDGEDTDSNGLPLDDNPLLSAIEPGIIEDLPADADIKFANPPGVDGYEPYSRISLQAIAAGVGLPYEVMTGDLSKVTFISGRLGRLDLKQSVETIQYQQLIPQFCEPIGQWGLDALEFAGADITDCEVRWTPPRFPIASPETEVPADRDAVRAFQKTPSQVLRERGEDPDSFWAEYAADMKRFDDAGLVVDCDPRRVTQVGNAVDPLTPEQMDK
jgi:lambda family phage portal protein